MRYLARIKEGLPTCDLWIRRKFAPSAPGSPRYRKYFAMSSYYAEKLSSESLRACYELAPPGTKVYANAEIEFVLQKTSSSMAILRSSAVTGECFASSCLGRGVWSELTLR
jgi:hypothetical protein